MGLTDQAAPIRRGEELPIERIEAFIRTEIDLPKGDLSIGQFPKGHSNLTYLVSVGGKEMVLRRPPHGTKAKSAHDMGREYRVLKALKAVYPYCPTPLAYCEDESVIGAPFYLMERLDGIIVRRDFPKEMKLSATDTTRLFQRILEVQHELHAIDFNNIGLGDFGKPTGYVQRQVMGWSSRYRKAKTPDAPDGEAVMDWLAANMPPDTDRPGIVHNDFKFDNVVLDPENPLEVIGVLDWEMATVGDPLMDLGCTLGYWIQPGDAEELQAIRMMPTHAPGALTREGMVERYAALSGRSVDNYNFYYCFGLFRLAVIIQQIYFRYYHGQTADKRFAAFIFGVQALLNAAARRLI